MFVFNSSVPAYPFRCFLSLVPRRCTVKWSWVKWVLESRVYVFWLCRTICHRKEIETIMDKWRSVGHTTQAAELRLARFYSEDRMSFSTDLLATGKRARERPHLHFNDVCKKRHEDRHGRQEVGRCRLRSLTVETQFTPRAESRRGDTEVFRCRKACSTERKEHSDITGEVR